MSGEQITESTAEAVETPEVTDVSEANETSEASASEVSLQNMYEMSDDELDVFLASDMPSNIPESDDFNEDVEVSEDVEENESSATETEETEETDIQAVYDRIFNTPFKANGKDFQIESVDEAIQLMQKGLGYNKSMEEIKPYKKALNVLKNRQALDPEKLDFLLDVAEGKPEAISKFLNDNNIDPYDIDIDSGSNYKSNYEDNELFDTVIEHIEQLPSESKTEAYSVLSSEGWDMDSKRFLLSNPKSVEILGRQIVNGQYAQIMEAVERKRAFGDLLNMSDLDAYNMVGTELANQGKLGVPNAPNESTTKVNPKSNVTLAQKRKKAAGAPRKAPSNVPTGEVFNPATASDEEVEKFLQNHLRNSG
jgi:hypothetical protein